VGAAQAWSRIVAGSLDVRTGLSRDSPTARV